MGATGRSLFTPGCRVRLLYHLPSQPLFCLLSPVLPGLVLAADLYSRYVYTYYSLRVCAFHEFVIDETVVRNLATVARSTSPSIV